MGTSCHRSTAVKGFDGRVSLNPPVLRAGATQKRAELSLLRMTGGKRERRSHNPTHKTWPSRRANPHSSVVRVTPGVAGSSPVGPAKTRYPDHPPCLMRQKQPMDANASPRASRPHKLSMGMAEAAATFAVLLVLAVAVPGASSVSVTVTVNVPAVM